MNAPGDEAAVFTAFDAGDAGLSALIPPLFRELMESGVPIRALLALAFYFGGTQVRIPLAPRPSSRLASLLHGHELKALIAVAGGEEVKVPRATRLRLELRNRWIRRLLASGHSKRDVALKSQLTQRTIFKIAAGARREGVRAHAKASERKGAST